MRRLALICATIALAAIAVGLIARSPAAQTASPEACRSDGGPISAAALPETVELEDCPIAGKVITDNGVGTVLPAPGQSIYVDSITTEGSQELGVTRHRNGTVALDHVGDETEAIRGEREIGAARSPGECSDRAYDDLNRKVKGDLRWYFNPRTTPDELARKGAVRAIRNGTRDITNTQNKCRLGDRVPSEVSITYEGSTRARAQIGTSGNCTGNDQRTVVSFGKLPKSAYAVTCTVVVLEAGYERVKWSDIMLNKAHADWTTRPTSRSCRGKYDLEGAVAHERGHTFGLGHVSESSHGKLTMSDRFNGACQMSERSLGRGDVLGLARKY